MFLYVEMLPWEGHRNLVFCAVIILDIHGELELLQDGGLFCAGSGDEDGETETECAWTAYSRLLNHQAPPTHCLSLSLEGEFPRLLLGLAGARP